MFLSGSLRVSSNEPAAGISGNSIASPPGSTAGAAPVAPSASGVDAAGSGGLTAA